MHARFQWFVAWTWPFVARLVALAFVPNRVRLAVLRAFGADISSGVQVRPRLRLADPAHLSVGRDSWIGEDVRIHNRSAPVHIGNDVVLSQAACIVTVPGQSAPLTVEPGAWLALRSTVSGPITIGERAVVAAAAVATGDVAPGTVVSSPAVRSADSLPEVSPTDSSRPDTSGPDDSGPNDSLPDIS